MIARIENGRLITAEGLEVDSFDSQCLIKYGSIVWGNVLEVGLGLARLHSMLRRNLEIRRHVCIEKERSVVEYHAGARILNPDADVIIGEVPFVTVPKIFDWVLLDIPDSRAADVVNWAAGALKETGGAIICGS